MFRILVAIICLLVGTNVYAFYDLSNPDGFGETKWGTHAKDVKFKAHNDNKLTENVELDRSSFFTMYYDSSDRNSIRIGDYIYSPQFYFFDKDLKFYAFTIFPTQIKPKLADQFNALVQAYGPPATVAPMAKTDFEKYFNGATWRLTKTIITMKKNGGIEFSSSGNDRIKTIRYNNADKNISIESNGSTVEFSNKTDKYISISSMSIYYGNTAKTNVSSISLGKTDSKFHEIPPLATISVPVSNIMTPSDWATYSKLFEALPLKFGIAIKYTSGNKEETLFKIFDF